MNSQKFQIFEITDGLMFDYNDKNFRTAIFGFTGKDTLLLPADWTHFGVVLEGEAHVVNSSRDRVVVKDDYFSIQGEFYLTGSARVVIISAFEYKGVNMIGGPIESTGRLRYIDGCTDSLLIPPVKKGDPCLNHLHFPENITQTPHTHPSVRAGVVLRGSGMCIVPDDHRQAVALLPGCVFVIPTDSLHSFNTQKDGQMDVIAFHPDSDIGVTDDDHPMVNRTIVDGISAKLIPEIRTNDN
jgi:hypothetical protein